MQDFFGLVALAFSRALTLRMTYVLLLSAFIGLVLRPFYPAESPMPELIMALAQVGLSFLFCREFITGRIDVNGPLIGRMALMIFGIFALAAVMIVPMAMAALAWSSMQNVIFAVAVLLFLAVLALTFFLIPAWAVGDRAPPAFLGRSAQNHLGLIVLILIATVAIPFSLSVSLWSPEPSPGSVRHDLLMAVCMTILMALMCALYARRVRPGRNPDQLSTIPTVSSLLP